MRGKIIEIEGTDCSGKETQSELLAKRLKELGYKVEKMAFPMYDTPTGKIVGGPYLGKKYISEGFFDEGASNVPAKVASLYYAADRAYNIPKIKKLLDEGVNVILDRYVYSNMAHQGGKIIDTSERMNTYAWLDVLEFKLLELPKPDICFFLYMPYEYSLKLRKSRKEEADQHESDGDYLKHAETSYKELVNIYDWLTIECVQNDEIREIDSINDDLLKNVIKILEN